MRPDVVQIQESVLADAVRELVEWADEIRSHYGVEECSGPGQPATAWDEAQEGLQDAAARVRLLLPPDDDEDGYAEHPLGGSWS